MATSFRFSVKGTRKLIAELKRREGVAYENAKRVQNKNAKEIIVDSTRQVPKRLWNLVKSARIQEDKSPRKRSIRVIGVTYDTDYAYVVHEDLNAKHKAGTNAKFLERPAKKRRRKYALEMKAAISGGLQ